MSTTQDSNRYSSGESTVIAAPRPAWLARELPPVRSRSLSEDLRRRRAVDRACRALNVVVASLGVVLAAPLMIVVWMLIRLTSPGPAIFSQARVGLDRRQGRRRPGDDERRRRDQGGRIFTIYKFRTMRMGEPESQVWASKDDPRITTVGRFLRATRLDEVPQLFNVLKGDMNIVGPRPEQPKIFESLSEEVGNYRQRQKVLPGITGLAQVRLPYDQSLDDVRRKVDLDLEYIRGRSAVKDLAIMARTPAVMVMRKGGM